MAQNEVFSIWVMIILHLKTYILLAAINYNFSLCYTIALLEKNGVKRAFLSLLTQVFICNENLLYVFYFVITDRSFHPARFCFQILIKYGQHSLFCFIIPPDVLTQVWRLLEEKKMFILCLFNRTETAERLW